MSFFFRVCLADNQPVVQYGVKAFFKDHSDIKIVSTVGDFNVLQEILKKKDIDILITDLELKGLSSINLIKSLLKEFPNVKIIIYTNLSEQIYAPNALKAGIVAYINKNDNLETLSGSILEVNQGKVVFSNDIIKKDMTSLGRKNKTRLYRKISTREVEVLRYLSEGKKNKEIAEILNLNERTISTYKLRLLTKLNVTNLIDLVNKAKKLEIAQ